MTNSSDFTPDFILLILLIAGYYWGKLMGFYWLWKTCQIILIIYGILFGILVIVLLIIGFYYVGCGIRWFLRKVVGK